MLGPYDAVNWLRWRVTNGATGKRFLSLFWCALVALCLSFFDQFHLTVIARCATLDERNIRRQTHSIDMIASLTIVQCIQNEFEFFKEANAIACP